MNNFDYLRILSGEFYYALYCSLANYIIIK